MVTVLSLLASVSPASAQDAITFDEPLVRFGVQPFGDVTLQDVQITNTSSETLLVTVNGETPDDFANRVESTCVLGQPTAYAPGESCVQVLSFRPSEFFAGPEAAFVVVSATDLDGNVVFEGRVPFVGYGIPRERVVDLTEHGAGALDPQFFVDSGELLRFLRGGEVATVQGDEAVLGPVGFVALGHPRGATVTFAPTEQGAAWYTFAAHGAGGEVLAGVRTLVTQDEGAESTDPPGYVSLSLVDVPVETRWFTVTNRFVESSDPAVTAIGFGVAELRLFADPLP